MYWIYQTRIYTWHNEYVTARLIDPEPRTLRQLYSSQGFKSPQQDNSYGANLSLTYQIRESYPRPDNYSENAGFNLYSERLVQLMHSFGVFAEVFPVNLVNREGNALHEATYYVFHSLEGVRPAMDIEKSEWTGDADIGIPQLVLDEDKIESRPICLCDHIFVPLMRDDVKQAIEQEEITGFYFLKPEEYRSGRFGLAPGPADLD